MRKHFLLCSMIVQRDRQAMKNNRWKHIKHDRTFTFPEGIVRNLSIGELYLIRCLHSTVNIGFISLIP